MKQLFYGGVHPAEHKEATEQKPIQPLAKAPAQVVIPMSMHIGAPCKPTVQKGDTVLVGQMIGATAGLGAPIHASVSGTVVAVEPRPGTGGVPTLSVVIENDFQNTLSPDCKPRENVDALSAQEIIDIIRDAGCTGMGGAGFPTHVKISSAVGKADTIIVNGAECEPYITADHRLMLEHGEKIIGGVRFIMKALQLDHAFIGIEDNKMNAVNHLKELVGDAKDITVQALRTRYPQGAEKQLIQAITGREVPPGKLPADVGCCVFNAATTAAIYDAVALGQPVYQRVITITGSAVYTSLSAGAEEIAVLVLTDEDAAAAALDGLEARVADQKAVLESYQPDEVSKLDSAIVEQRGNSVLLAVAADAEKARAALDGLE